MNHIYIDGSYCNHTKKAGIGVPCFKISESIRARDSISAEIVAAIRASLRAKHSDVLVSDCKTLVIATQQRKTLRNHRELCLNLFKIMQSKCLSIRWVSRDENKKANLLAKRGRKLK